MFAGAKLQHMSNRPASVRDKLFLPLDVLPFLYPSMSIRSNIRVCILPLFSQLNVLELKHNAKAKTSKNSPNFGYEILTVRELCAFVTLKIAIVFLSTLFSC